MNSAASNQRRQPLQRIAQGRMGILTIRSVDHFHTHDEGAAKLLSDNRERYIAQSKATRNGQVAEPITEEA